MQLHNGTHYSLLIEGAASANRIEPSFAVFQGLLKARLKIWKAENVIVKRQLDNNNFPFN